MSTPRHPPASAQPQGNLHTRARTPPAPNVSAAAAALTARASHPSPAPSAILPPSVPVLPGTLLGLELLLQRQAIDLRAARDLLCEDPGALLHLFALISEEFPNPADRPARLEDCIASLSAERLLHALVQAGSTRREHTGGSLLEQAGGSRPEQTNYAHFARHGAVVGRYAQVVADALGVSREQALLVGTLHELGSLPAVLNWATLLPPERETIARCEDLGRRYGLPRPLRTALDAVHRDQPNSIWVAVIAAAHDLLSNA